MPLIHADRPTTVTGIVLLGGDTRFDEATQFHESNATGKILVLERPAGRLERLQIVAPPHVLERRALIENGIPDNQIGLVPRSKPDDSLSEVLLQWLNRHPDESVVVLCDAFDSRAVRWELDRRLPSLLASRVAIRPLPSKSYDSSVWWHDKRGVMGFARAWIGLVLPVIQNGDNWKWRECDPELFEPGVT